MRRVLVDYFRHKDAQKRPPSGKSIVIDDLNLSIDDQRDTILVVDEALTALEELDPRAAQVVELRYFGGFSVDETASILKVNPKTVTRDWEFARSWLKTYISGKPPEPPDQTGES